MSHITEIWFEIFLHVDISELSRLATLNKQIYTILQTPFFWKRRIDLLTAPYFVEQATLSAWIKEEIRIQDAKRKTNSILNDIRRDLNHLFCSSGVWIRIVDIGPDELLDLLRRSWSNEVETGEIDKDKLLDSLKEYPSALLYELVVQEHNDETFTFSCERYNIIAYRMSLSRVYFIKLIYLASLERSV